MASETSIEGFRGLRRLQGLQRKLLGVFGVFGVFGIITVMNHHERIRLFAKEIWRWYAVHKRSLPWRDLPDTDPVVRTYKILVSEIMLQQTQVSRVIVTYRNFLERFPTPTDLAKASNKDVIIAWKGMGYNSRAIRLRDAARVIVERCHPERSEGRQRGIMVRSAHHDILTSMEDLLSLPGVGHYTAAAIRNFAFGIPTPCIDTNIRRIIQRTFVGPRDVRDEELLRIAANVLQEALKYGTTQEWHAALMDFGSLVQTKRNPKWEKCPLTARGIMRTTKKNYELRIMNERRQKKSEPGRLVGSTFIPNRIFRGKIIDELRDASSGLTLHQLGPRISIDWDTQLHASWLRALLQKLQKENFLEMKQGRYALRD